MRAAELAMAVFVGFCIAAVLSTNRMEPKAQDEVCSWHCGGTDVAEWTGEACYCADVVEVTP